MAAQKGKTLEVHQNANQRLRKGAQTALNLLHPLATSDDCRSTTDDEFCGGGNRALGADEQSLDLYPRIDAHKSLATTMKPIQGVKEHKLVPSSQLTGDHGGAVADLDGNDLNDENLRGKGGAWLHALTRVLLGWSARTERAERRRVARRRR